jgi:hypothetical protein
MRIVAVMGVSGMRKLGMWQRLGIVLTVLWAALVPTWYVIDQGNSAARARDAWREYCVADARKLPATEFITAYDKCWSEWRREMEGDHVWSAWPQAFEASIVAAVVFWLLFAAAFFVVKWILAGRLTTGDDA